ncbi:MAG: 1,4-alpha-glucan branching enzyme, partial [Zetaproteobacteria bacterium]
IAEESTAWPLVSRPVEMGGLGFTMKWNMGWMNDALRYFARDPVHRRYHHNEITFSLMYAFSENFVLPISHDEVVHGKGSMPEKMPGDVWQKFANLRAFYAYMWTHPGKKLLFMGCEFGQWREWSHDEALDWHLLSEEGWHTGLQRLVRDLNHLVRQTPPLYELDFSPEGFQWLDPDDAEHSTLSYLRWGRTGRFVVVVLNLTPVPRHGWRVGVPRAGRYRELINTDSALYGGSNLGNGGFVEAEAVPWHGMPYSLQLVLPPLAGLILAPEGEIPAD